jgi:rifampicin phosphotransferase
MEAPWVVRLETGATAAGTRAPHPEHLGGKASGLARLIDADLPVPRAFVVTTRAFSKVVAPAVRGLTNADAIAARIRELDIPLYVRAEIEAGLGWLGDGPYAVRSSATGEDGAGASYAGQQASFLGSRDLDDVLGRVRDVWASVFADASLVYHAQVSLEGMPPVMAVIVQRAIPARAAGVCFTANPVSGASDEIIISAAPGLGESVVGGGPSDTWYLSRSDGSVRRKEVSEKLERLVMDGGDTRSELLAAEERGQASLTAADLHRVYALAVQSESVFQGPQDVEWVLGEEGGLWLVQSRPITGAPKQADGRRVSVWTNANVGEALPGVGTPMTWSIIRSFSRLGFEAAFGALGLEVPEDYALVGSFYGRVYLNLTQFASVITQIPLMQPETLLELAGGPKVEQLEGGYDTHSARGFLLRLPLTVPRIVAAQVGLPLVGRQWARHVRARRDTFFARDLKRDSRGDLVRELDRLDSLFHRTGRVMIACSSNFLSSYVLTKHLLRRWGGEDAARRERELFSGLSGMKSAQPGLELLRMAGQARHHASLVQLILERDPAQIAADLSTLDAVDGGKTLRRQLEAFLHEYGHRAPREAEIATPRWREDPRFLIEVLRTYLEAPYLPSPEELAQEGRAERLETTHSIRRHFRPGLGLVFRQALRLSQSNARLREELRACVVDTLDMYRHFFLDAGRRMVAREALSNPDDVFFLTYEEVRAWLEADGQDDDSLGLRVALRRAAYDHFRALPDPPDDFMLVDGVIVTTDPEPVEGRAALTGLPGSPGRITGPARVIFDPSDAGARLRPGEVLVAPLTDVGWTPLFLAASAVVMDKGGPLSHSCVVAREYGIPAAVNVRGATARIRTGDIITVDGDRGVVYLPP